MREIKGFDRDSGCGDVVDEAVEVASQTGMHIDALDVGASAEYASGDGLIGYGERGSELTSEGDGFEVVLLDSLEDVIPKILRCFHGKRSRNPSFTGRSTVSCAVVGEPLKVMISGAPASGKGTQCEMLVEKYGLVHISTGDLLRAEVSSGTKIGIKVKEFMENGSLVPDEIVTDIVKSRISKPDVKERGWLLDGYPRTAAQAQSLERLGIRPDICVVLDVPDQILVDRCVGRRLDPVTRKIYHVEYDPPESEEVNVRLIIRPDDTVEKVEINIPELNPEMDVYRIGTLMELVRALALSFADDGKHVKVCVQGSMGEGALAGMPLQLAGCRKILEGMDWGSYDAKGIFINIGSIGAKEVDEQDDIYILVAPQNAVGNCIIDDLQAMTDAAGHRPVILVNPRLKDLPASSGIMQTMGRDKRLEYAASFEYCYSFRLLYYAGTLYPIMGALRMSYPYRYELFKRIDESSRKEKYVILATFPHQPTVDEINDAFQGRPRTKEKTTSGIWYGI
ncbi:hypothetical protein QJS10_CPB19g00648 [Acorus calamus]|uniref:adenylate kinase n=1 Tax=Acorus calamus TaxID=4465 RepID=A0AAV9CIV6_ACOCL|nr:hypothetical protein QJS10_CPB19g00648 [Acorus calamus]